MSTHSTEEQSGFASLTATAEKLAEDALALNSKRAYASDLSDFASWCKSNRRTAMPASPETLALYLAKIAGQLKISSIRRRISAIKKAHECRGHKTPTNSERVRAIVRGIVRSNKQPTSHSSPTLLNDIRKMISALPNDVKGKRDKALLLIGFASGMRSYEIVSLKLEDIIQTEEGIILNISNGENNNQRYARKIAISLGSKVETCPVCALKIWLESSDIKDGAIFRPLNKWGALGAKQLTEQSVRLIVKESLKRAGLAERGFTGHSLRAGFATVAAINGATERQIQANTGHINMDVLRRYIRDSLLFKDNASSKLGL